VVIVQRIVTQWTKASRGAAGARRRNAVPEAFELTVVVKPAEAICYHHMVTCCESRNFDPQHTVFWSEAVTPLPPHMGTRCGLRLSYVDQSLEVEATGGMSPWLINPKSQLRNSFRLRQGQQGRARWNYRLVGADTGNWYYEKTVFNIAFITDLARDCFVRQQPHFFVDRMALLR